jgi:type II secretory pathway pseudopilin PulG
VRVPDPSTARPPADRQPPSASPRRSCLRRGRAGAVLLEAIVALLILSVAGTAAVTLVSQSADAVRRAREADAEARAASDFLHAVSLWTRDDLDRRLGDRPQGDWRLRIQRPAPTLYEVVLVDSAGGRELLRTALFRPEPAAAEAPESAFSEAGSMTGLP